MNEILSLRQEIEKHFKSMQQIALVLTSGDEDEAHEVLQGSVARMLKYEHKYKEGTSFRSWAFIIMRNHFYNRCSKKQTERKLFVTTERVPEIQAKQKREQRDISFCDDFSCLSDNHKIVLDLTKDGYSGKQIAEILNIPHGSVRSRTHYARKQLKKRMEKMR